MQNFFSPMEHALCVGTMPKAKIASVPERKPYWLAEFQHPVDAALHLGTPPASPSVPVQPVVHGNPHFFN